MEGRTSCEHPLDKIVVLDTPRGFRALCKACGEKSPGKVYKQDACDSLIKRGEAGAEAGAGEKNR